MVEWLMESFHPEVNVKDMAGYTPLDIARENKNQDIINYLTKQ